MAEPLTDLQKGTPLDDAYAIISDNFHKVIQDLRDLGANLSTTGEHSVTLTASSVTAFVFTLTSLGSESDSAHQVFTTKPVSSVLAIAPQLDIYVDTDDDDDFLWPNGASLSVDQLKLFPIITPSQTGYANSLGAWSISLNNRDVNTHTYYIRTRTGYFPSGPTGFFR